jgi:hypothetical protein
VFDGMTVTQSLTSKAHPTRSRASRSSSSPIRPQWWGLMLNKIAGFLLHIWIEGSHGVSDGLACQFSFSVYFVIVACE